MAEELLRCSGCELDLPPERFHRDRARSTGRRPDCKQCFGAKQRERRRDPAVKAKARDAWRRWYRDNAAHRAAYERDWRAEHRESARATSAKQYALRPESTKLSNAVRRSGRQRPSQDTQGFMALLHRDPCAYCGGRGGTIDHIDPISDGGAIDWSNLTSACRRCNAQKHNQAALPFLLKKLGLV